MEQRDGQHHRPGPGLPEQPRRRASRRRDQRHRGPRKPARRLDRLGQRQRRPVLRRRATRPRRSTAATTRTRPNGTRGLEPGRHEPAHRHRPRRRRPGVAPASRTAARWWRAARSARRPTRSTAPTARRPRAGRSSPPTACSPPPRRATSTARARTTSSVGGASSQGFALGTHYANGGHVRIYNDHGGLICSANTNEEVDSSPAVGPILPGGGYGIATGHGQLLPGRQRREHRQGVRHQVQPGVERHASTARPAAAPRWPTCRATASSPWSRARSRAPTAAAVWALNAATGVGIWQTSVPGAVIGSVTTADLTGSGAPGRHRADRPRASSSSTAPAGRSWPTSTTGRATVAFLPGRSTASRTRRWSPLTPTARSGITVAGYFAVTANGGNYVQGIVQHFEVAGSTSTNADAAGGWPQFHHDAAADRVRRGRRRPGDLRPPRGGPERVPHGRLRRRDLRVRAGLLREHGKHDSEQARGGHGGRPRSRRVLAGRFGWRGVLLRRRGLLRLDRVTDTQRTGRGHGGHP